MKNLCFLILALVFPLTIYAEEPDSISYRTELKEVVIGENNGIRRLHAATNAQLITAKELTRAACCNLGESFTTNPSVDVSYSDAATGAKQIRLLGLSGSYVQMLTENVPAFRGVASPYGPGYIAGPWMQSIQVSKGASSVKNGYESTTGQINVEIKKPQADPTLNINAYADHLGKVEINADGNLHFGDRWSGGLLIHGEKAFASHDENNDGFADMPKIRQVALMNRWAYLSRNYVFQIAAKYLDEERRGGQDGHHTKHADSPLYKIDMDTRRAEVYAKNAYIFDRYNDGNVALILSANYHRLNSLYGVKAYNATQREGYASLMYEQKFAEGKHAVSTGLSYSFDDLHQDCIATAGTPAYRMPEHEAVTGAYAQYTFNADSRFIAMCGLRYDYSTFAGNLVTPRLHLRWTPSDIISLNASAGIGRRTPHVMAELSYLLASSREIIADSRLHQEEAANYGISATVTPRWWEKRMSLGLEYYYTDFIHQLCVNFDRDPHAVYIYSLYHKSYGHTFQTELNVKARKDLNILAAYRLTDVKTDYGFGYVQKPLTSRSKGLLSLGYTPMMGLWQADVTLAIDGGGRMPRSYITADGNPAWSGHYGAYATLSAQVTRNFRHWSVYIGGENLTGYRQKHAIIDAANPWGSKFDSTMIYGPLHGAVVYAGFRYHITKYL